MAMQTSLLVMFMKWSVWRSGGQIDLDGVIEDRLTAFIVVHDIKDGGIYEAIADPVMCYALVRAAFGKRA